jgi:cellulose biosynthesis protein BcsQ
MSRQTHTLWLLAVDTDTQANLTRSLLPEPLAGPGMEALFDPAADVDVQNLIRPTKFPGIDILPAGPVPPSSSTNASVRKPGRPLPG